MTGARQHQRDFRAHRPGANDADILKPPQRIVSTT
jgi:hypothetical protein